MNPKLYKPRGIKHAPRTILGYRKSGAPIYVIAGGAPAPVVGDPKNSRLVELRGRITEIDSDLLTLVGLGETRALTEDEDKRYEDLTTERDVLAPECEKLEERAARAESIRNKTFRTISGLPDPRKSSEDTFGQDVRKMDWRTARDGALRILEDRESSSVLSDHQMEVIDKTVRNARQSDISRRILVTENDAYRSAFHKLMTRGPEAVVGFSDEERVAMQRYEEYRAIAEGGTTTGGYAIPVFIDPSVILTAQETDNPFLRICRQENVTTNAWKGVSSAGVSWSFDAEGSAVSDDAPTPLGQPSVTVYMARGFIPYSIEAGDDWPGFQAEMARLLADGYDELLIDKFSQGSGTGEPRGILTALDANTNVEVVVTTDGAFGSEDIYKVWKSLPQKYRGKAAWMGSVDVNNKIRQFGTANLYHAATVNLEAGAAEVIMNKPWYESPYFPDFTATTGAANLLVVGDFSNYVIAKRTGMNVELVPQLFDVTNNRPTGQRGWFAHVRIGGNSVNDLAFRLLQNQ